MLSATSHPDGTLRDTVETKGKVAKRGENRGIGGKDEREDSQQYCSKFSW